MHQLERACMTGVLIPPAIVDRHRRSFGVESPAAVLVSAWVSIPPSEAFFEPASWTDEWPQPFHALVSLKASRRIDAASFRGRCLHAAIFVSALEEPGRHCCL